MTADQDARRARPGLGEYAHPRRRGARVRAGCRGRSARSLAAAGGPSCRRGTHDSRGV